MERTIGLEATTGVRRKDGASSTLDVEFRATALNTTTCHKHPQNVTRFTCMTCVKIHCDKCNSSHFGHDVRQFKGDAGEDKLIQKVFRKQIMELYDIKDLVDASKENVSVKRSAVTEAKIAVRRVVDTATRLGRQAEKQLDDLEKVVSNVEQNASEEAKTVDDKIARLTELRNVSNTDVLMPEAVETAAILDKFNIKQITEDRFSTLVDALPNNSTVNDVVYEISRVLHINVDIQYEYTATTEEKQIPIPNTDRRRHRICEASVDDGNSILLHDSRGSYIHSYNTKTGNIDRGSSTIEIWSMVKLDQNTFLAKESLENTFHLLDGNYSIKSTSDTPHRAQGICYHSESSFILMTKTDQIPSSVTLQSIRVDKGRFVTQTELTLETEDEPYFVSCQPKTNIVIMVSNDRLYMVDMNNPSLKTHDISQCVNGISSIHIDCARNVLLGGDDGNIHLFDTQMNHRIVANVSDKVCGITLRGESMFVIAGTKIWKFKVPLHLIKSNEVPKLN